MSILALYNWSYGIQVKIGEQNETYFIQPISILNRSNYIKYCVGKLNDFNELHLLKDYKLNVKVFEFIWSYLNGASDEIDISGFEGSDYKDLYLYINYFNVNIVELEKFEAKIFEIQTSDLVELFLYLKECGWKNIVFTNKIAEFIRGYYGSYGKCFKQFKEIESECKDEFWYLGSPQLVDPWSIRYYEFMSINKKTKKVTKSWTEFVSDENREGLLLLDEDRKGFYHKIEKIKWI